MVFFADFDQTIQGFVTVAFVQVLEVEPKTQVGGVVKCTAPIVEGCIGGLIGVMLDKKRLLNVVIAQVDFQTGIVVLEMLCLFDVVGLV